MKLKFEERANWPTTPDNRGIIYVSDEDAEWDCQSLGRIFDPHSHRPVGSKHSFRPDDIAGMTEDQMRSIADELKRLDDERDVFLAGKTTKTP